MAEEIKKEELTKQDKKHRVWFAVRMVIFVVVTLCVLTWAIYVLTPKYQYGICGMYNYYWLPEDSVDVLAVGTSLSYTDLNTNILWSEYGIACYDLGTAEQPYWSTYYYLKEALKYQKPKLVLLDLKACTYFEDTVDRTRTVLCTFGILDPINRLSAIKECVEDSEFLGYALAFSQIHTNYVKLSEEMFKLPASNGNRGQNWKGYVEKDEIAEHDTPSIKWDFETRDLLPHEEEYFRKILQLCVDEGVEVMLIGYPNADYKHDHYYYCRGFEIAEEYGITGINYNLPENRPDIDFATEVADWQHLNISGSVKFTEKVGADLKELYDLPDRRGDEHYESYQAEADRWYTAYPKYSPYNY